MRPVFKQLMIASVGVSIAGISVRSARQLGQEERQKRAAIHANTEATIAAMKKATDTIIKRIDSGYYDGKSILDIDADWKFENIVEFNKD